MIVKTEMRKHILRSGSCPLGYRCMYAHARKELQLTTIYERFDAGRIDDINTFRSTLCFDYVATGACPFNNNRCACIHDHRMKALAEPAWLPKLTKGIKSISTEIHVDWNHYAKQNIVNYGVNLPYTQARSLFGSVDAFYSIVTGQDAVKDLQASASRSTLGGAGYSVWSGNRTIPELVRLEVALAMMKKRDKCYVPYKYKPTHAIMDRLCAVINECAFEILPGQEPGSSLKIKEIPFAKYDTYNARHVSVHEVAFAPYGYSRCYEDIPLPMLLFNLDAKKVLSPATRRMIIAYENAKKDEVQQLTRQTIQERCNRRRISPFVPVPTKRFDKLIEDMRKVGKCHYPVLYSQDREMHDMIIDAIALRIDMILGKEPDAREKTRALEQKFTSLMRFYKDSVNAWPLCDGQGNMFIDQHTEVYDVETIYRPYISTTDQSDAERGQGKLLHHYREGILSSFFDNLDAVDDDFETVYPLLFWKEKAI
ncbi:hypothetical protein CTEN210_06301 [Chaetoceros tenuissimus]|uniref:C3H1-type domain-containing protein n=1 Tax=Chaetoceros tenuissimus TaxID=426638 RepID=A0AAD3CRP9_9STRA|nr:hypothetical protein CTEN210_06301 [Chaetoceros tenuissimus]